MTAAPSPSAPLRVAVADDELLVREGAKSVLASVPWVTVTGTAGDAVELLALIDTDPPDAVLLDVRMPPTYTTEGIQAAHLIRSRHAGTGVVILSQHADPEYALELLRNGSQGLAYLLKERLGRPAQLAEALLEVANGGSILDPKVVDGLLAAQHRRSRSRLHGLTEREHEVLTLMATGRTNAAIAQALVLSERAVEKHSNSIFRKLGLGADLDINQRVGAVLFLLERNAD